MRECDGIRIGKIGRRMAETVTKEEAWTRHIVRVNRLKSAEDKKAEYMQIVAEIMDEGFSEEYAKRAARESWNFAKGPKK